ncbi:stage II sporulation protein D, partial [Gracilibacillus oryzae]
MSKKRMNTSKINWKLIVIIGSSSLLMIMFLIPTIVVIPFKGHETTASSVEVSATDQPAAAETQPITLESPFHVNVLRTASEQVEKVPLEDYVIHVVASEMPADFELEALKAQALAARTYIIRYLMAENTKKLAGGADVTDTVQHQVYKNNDELR